MGAKPPGRMEPKIFLKEGIRDVIMCFKFGDDRFRGLASAEGQILPFPIDFEGRPYNTLTLPCERVIQRGFDMSSVVNNAHRTSRQTTDNTHVIALLMNGVIAA